MSCVLEGGSPTPEVTWSRVGGALWPAWSTPGAGPTARLVNVTRHDAGIYRCRADNGSPAPADGTVRLVVEHRPYIDPSGSFVHSSPLDNAALTCTVAAHPPARVDWWRGLYQLSSLQYNISSSGAVHTLTLPPDETRLGNYSCTANNTLGVATKQIMLSNKVCID